MRRIYLQRLCYASDPQAVVKLKDMEKQLTKLTTMVEERDKIIAGHSSILQEINSKLTVTEQDSTPHEETKAPDSNLRA